MPTLTVNDQSFEVENGKRLVLSLEDNGINILHRCGGYARCTTCRVEFRAGEPDKITEAEKTRIQDEEQIWGKARLSCQILVEHDMTVEPVMTVENSELDDPGKRPEDHITPNPVWTTK